TLSHQVGRDDIGKGAALHVLHHNPEFILVKERVDIVDDIRMTRCAHHKNFVDDEILFRLLVQVHLFDGNRKICSHLVSSEDTTGCPTYTQGESFKKKID